MSRIEELEGIVRESGSLPERLAECRSRIGKMCSEGRPPKMSIPVQWNDDDFFINTTLKDAEQSVRADGANCLVCGEPLAETALHEFCFSPESPRK